MPFKIKLSKKKKNPRNTVKGNSHRAQAWAQLSFLVPFHHCLLPCPDTSPTRSSLLLPTALCPPAAVRRISCAVPLCTIPALSLLSLHHNAPEPRQHRQQHPPCPCGAAGPCVVFVPPTEKALRGSSWMPVAARSWETSGLRSTDFSLRSLLSYQ